MSEMERPPLRVLVVEDDAGTAAALTAFLAGLDGVQTVGTAGNGAEGLEYIRRAEPDLVLLDLVMPGMDGLELLERLRAEKGPEGPYIIVLSGVSSDVTVQRALGLGAGFYMVKPVSLVALGERIHDRLGRGSRETRPGGREALARWYLEKMGGGRLTGAALVCTAAAALAENGGMALKAAYASVRKAHGVKYVNAEQAIRRCIEALHREDRPAYRDLMGGTPGERPPSNGVFLRRLAEKLADGSAEE